MRPDPVFCLKYDAYNHWIARKVDPDGDGGAAAIKKTFFLYDRGQIALQLDKIGAGDALAEDLSHRYLWGNKIDQLFADESPTGGVLWALADHLNTVRDLARYDAATNTTAVVNHRTFDGFGELTGETSPTFQIAFGFTGAVIEIHAGLANRLNRWYDFHAGRWLSEDPLGFAARDANLDRYVGNSVTILADPTGLFPPIPVMVYPPTVGERVENPLTPDQKKALELAGDDEATRHALMELFAVLEQNPTYHYRPWPFATGDRCHAWASGTHSDILDEKLKGNMKVLGVSRWNPMYIGWIPTFTNHAVLIVTLPNGKKFYLDNALEGDSTDHIFFEIPDSLVDKNSKEYAEWLERQTQFYLNSMGA